MKKILPFLAITILFLAWGYGYMNNKMNVEVVSGYYRQMVPEAVQFTPINDRIAKAIGLDGNIIAYIGVSNNTGYGGPMMVGTIIDPTGAFKNIIILQHKETPSYIRKITQNGYFRQYTKKNAADPLVLDFDLDGVSGATLSSRAIAKSVAEVAHTIAVKELRTTPQKADIPWKIGIKEIAVASLFILSNLLLRLKLLAKYRIVFLGFSVITLGFWLNRSLSMGQISAMFLGYFPSPSDNLIWYLVLMGALAPALLTGKNQYCIYVCPFCCLQETAHNISKVNLSSENCFKWFKIIKEIILFAVLFLAFIFSNPSFSSIEPFGTIFGLNGSSNQWYLLFVILMTSFFYRRFWCKAFCPVGTFLDKVAGLGRRIRGIISSSQFNRAEKAGVKFGE